MYFPSGGATGCIYCGGYGGSVPVLIYNRNQDRCPYCAGTPPLHTQQDWYTRFINGVDENVRHHVDRGYFEGGEEIFTMLPRGCVPPVRNQGDGVNSCLEIQSCDLVACQLSWFSGHPVYQLSPQDLIDNARKIDAGANTSQREVRKYFRQTGVCYEYVNPYRGIMGGLAPPLEGLVSRVKVSNFREMIRPTFDSVCAHLYNVGPLLASFHPTQRFKECFRMVDGVSLYQGILSQSESHDVFFYPDNVEHIYENRSMHALLVIGYDKREQALIVQNTYGTSWGYLGFLKIKYDSFMKQFIYPAGISISVDQY